MTLQHQLGCSGPDVHTVHGITRDLVTCRACRAETIVKRALP